MYLSKFEGSEELQNIYYTMSQKLYISTNVWANSRDASRVSREYNVLLSFHLIHKMRFAFASSSGVVYMPYIMSASNLKWQ